MFDHHCQVFIREHHFSVVNLLLEPSSMWTKFLVFFFSFSFLGFNFKDYFWSLFMWIFLYVCDFVSFDHVGSLSSSIRHNWEHTHKMLEMKPERKKRLKKLLMRVATISNKIRCVISPVLWCHRQYQSFP